MTINLQRYVYAYLNFASDSRLRNDTMSNFLDFVAVLGRCTSAISACLALQLGVGLYDAPPLNCCPAKRALVGH